MENAYTIVVSDPDLLSRLCGTNDINLRLIEQFLEVPVFTRGNEISIAGAPSDTQDTFKFIIERLLDEAHDGSDIDGALVHAVLEGFADLPSGEIIQTTSIRIPGAVRTVYPKTLHQAEAVAAMRTFDMVFCVGPAGSGKTFLAVAQALEYLFSRKKKRIILTRPVVEAGESLGFLPGDLEQKINPYLRPLYDAVEYLIPRDMLRKCTESGIIETAPLAYMRGRTLSDSVIILDEAQNTTIEQMKMFLTRMGEGSKVFITGDITQIDLPRRVPSGLVHALKILDGIEGIKIMQMDVSDIVRNPLVRKIVQAYADDKTYE